MQRKFYKQKGVAASGAKLSVLAALMLSLLAQPVAFAQEKQMSDQPLSAQGPDSDADGIRNQDDQDDDNDGILDVNEGLVDLDNDGFPDDASTDTDGDGTPDVLDLDSDNDGILDNLEARADREAVKQLDLNPNGAIDIAFPVGANGIPDAIETSIDSGILIYNLLDSDADGIPDFRDTDSDNDGIFDLVEAGGTDSNADGRLDGFFDADGKGVDDAVQSSALPIFDTDGDGILDFRDSDSDGDGIPDAVEAGTTIGSPTDTDGDGAADYRESDSDGDGISDTIEAGGIASEPADSDGNGVPDYQDASFAGGTDSSNTDNSGSGTDGAGNSGIDVTAGPDTDGDGIANQYDLDDDNDGIPDSVEGFIDDDGDPAPGSRDTDGDGTPDGWDLDSDNDGLLDNREAHPDFNFVSAQDQVVNGAIDIGIAVGSNGLADIIETYPGSGELNYLIQDTDGDGTPDFMDIDSDGDGISDLFEAGGVDINCDARIDSFTDIDDKGVDDAIQASALPVFDTDGDGVADYRDSDSDQDGIADSIEAGNDGCRPQDTDGDGAADYRERDSDGDNVLDGEDSNNDAADVQPFEPVSDDVDNDGIPNDMDLDDDNDGLPDTVEGVEDTDRDKTLNQYDLDSDNDGITDLSEASKLVAIVRDLDTDGDGRLDAAIGSNGLADVLESTPDSGTTIFTVADSDGDGIPDFKDMDSDNDSIYDSIESGHSDANADGLIDTVGQAGENGLAPGASNGLVDTDNDTVFDNRDLDSDNDGIVDLIEARGLDVDGDGRIDSFTDIDGDGADDGLQRITTDIVDTDSDRVPDFRDLDSDQDGVSDITEALGSNFDANNDGLVDNFIDFNRDGYDDNLAANPVVIADTDRDGKPDQVDLDSDGDGISDLTESGGVDIDSNGTVDDLTDSDNDGIPDVVDVDITGGNDSDQDGIDDTADVTFTGGNDTDGDGIDDNSDPDNDGNGFTGPSDSMGQNDAIILPDSNANGIPDIKENNSGNSMNVKIDSNSSGMGCAISDGSVGQGKDPALLAMLLFAIVSLMWRVRRRVALRLSQNRKGLRSASLLALLTSTVVISGCSSFGFDGFGGSNRGGNDNFKSRIYVGAGGLVSQLEPSTEGDSGVSVDEKQSAGFTGLLGYDISNRFSVEGHVSDLGEATFNPSGSVGYQVGGLSGLVYFLNDDTSRGRREGFSMYGRLGAGTMQNQGEGITFSRVNDYHLLAGIGAEYGMRNGLGIRAEVVSHETDAQYAQLGLVYRFGSAGRSTSTVAVAPEQPEVVTAPVAPKPEVFQTELDSDADGVADAIDACPNSNAGSPVNADGCELFNGVIEGVNFESSSDKLTGESTEILRGVAQTLLSYPDIRVAIEAHTDNQGSAASNLELSKQRAISVARFLVAEGVAASRLRPQAFGESQPRETNDSAEGRALNRRVEFKVVN